MTKNLHLVGQLVDVELVWCEGNNAEEWIPQNPESADVGHPLPDGGGSLQDLSSRHNVLFLQEKSSIKKMLAAKLICLIESLKWDRN